MSDIVDITKSYTTRDEREVVIFEVSDKVYCKIKFSDGWAAVSRSLSGMFYDCGKYSNGDLILAKTWRAWKQGEVARLKKEVEEEQNNYKSLQRLADEQVAALREDVKLWKDKETARYCEYAEAIGDRNELRKASAQLESALRTAHILLSRRSTEHGAGAVMRLLIPFSFLGALLSLFLLIFSIWRCVYGTV